MKNCIAFLLTFVLVFSLSITVFADDIEVDRTQEYQGYGESVVKGKIYSSCVITIPETIDFSECIEWSIGITNADIEDGCAVNIYIINLNEKGAITLQQDNGDFTADLYLGLNGKNKYITSENNLLATFYDTDITSARSTAPIMCTGKIVAPGLFEKSGVTAGTYTGTMQYEVKIEPYGD